MKTLIAATLALSVVTTAPALAQVMSPMQYVAAAGASDLYERQSSQMVLATTQDPKVKAFAAMMIKDHSQSTSLVTMAAAKSSLSPSPPMLTPLQAELIAELQATHGPERDAAYIAQQKASHNQALTVQKAYAMDGEAPALKSAAAHIVPVVQHHIEMLKAM